MLESLTAAQIAAMACIVFVSFVVRGASGFGAGLIGVPLLALIIPVHAAVALFGLLVVLLFTFLGVRDWGDVEKIELKRLVPSTLLGVVAGVVLYAYFDSNLLLRLMGGFLIVYALYTLAVQIFKLPEITCSPAWAVPAAFVGAILDTLFGGGGGPLLVIYLYMRRVSQSAFRATLAVLLCVGTLGRIVGYAAAGYYTKDMWLPFVLFLPLMAAGTWLGERIGNRISRKTFSRLMAVLLLLAGVGLLAK